jgi:beta-lactamase superfamily II metal-dependent hydrolase
MITHADNRILLCADMEKEAEEDLAGSGMILRADVLRVGHHGGATSTTRRFLKRVSPRWAIISSGTNNRFGHPSPDAVGRLKANGVKILRTDLNGAVILTSDGRDIMIETYM